MRTAGGVDRTSVVGPAVTPLTLTDPLAPAVLYPRFGQYAARVNFTNAATTPNRNANALLQQSVVTLADVDSSDGLVHVRFAYLPVLEDGSHNPDQQAYFYIAIRNVTKSTMVWERFTFANEPGVPWQSSGLYRYTDWQLVDASGGAGVIDIGDTLELEVIAAGCNQTGHRGHVYVDAFGSTIPGGTVVATAPASVNAGAPIDLQPPRRQRRRRRPPEPGGQHHDASPDDASRRSPTGPARTRPASSPATSPTSAPAPRTTSR